MKALLTRPLLAAVVQSGIYMTIFTLGLGGALHGVTKMMRVSLATVFFPRPFHSLVPRAMLCTDAPYLL